MHNIHLVLIYITIIELGTNPPLSTLPLFSHEPGRAHSYLPYSNHLPDLVQSRTELYVEEDTATLASATQVDMVNSEDINNYAYSSQLESNEKAQIDHNLPSAISITEKLRYKRQKDQSKCYFHTTFSKNLCLFLSITVLLSIAGVIIYFCWPRIPLITFISEKAERMGEPADWGPNPHPWLRANWRINMTLNNRMNYIDTHIDNIEFTIFDRDTHRSFGWTRINSLQLPAKKEIPISLIFRIDYESNNITDPTFKNLYNACGPQMPTEPPALNVTVEAIIRIAGLAWSSSTVVGPSEQKGFYCPSS
ncbi:hypothetical protein BDB01DRAFT_813499 [Pilobolus umbonatus]|nr:hypothetical protein BDB01DRAFT_813499 [Pilobolus umbonatus]